MYGQSNKRQKKEIFKVYWLGKNPNYMYFRDFTDPSKAKAFSDGVKDSMTYHLEGADPKKMTAKLKMMPNEDSDRFIKSVKLHRKLGSNQGFANMDGIAEVAVSTTTEYQKSQKIRLLDVFVLAPAIFYGGWKLMKNNESSSQPTVSTIEGDDGIAIETVTPQTQEGGVGGFVNKALPYLLMAIGVATAYYNGKNYLINKKGDKKTITE